jgi:hypothetical protein
VTQHEHDTFIAELCEKLDRALVSSEAAKKAQHDANGRAQKAVAVAELAISELKRAYMDDAAARMHELLRAALEGV